jgi:dTDP-4-dehydrorhamnose reductase/SAM-dependent methyltransferase
MAHASFPHSVLIVGGDSPIGAALAERLRGEGWSVATTSRHAERCGGAVLHFDLAAGSHALPLAQFGSVVLCAAVSSMARCEQEAAECERLNVHNTLKLAEDSLAAGCFVVFLSSTAVFDGSKAFAGPDEPPAPASNYGRFKLAVEQRLLDKAPARAAILRIGKVIGPRTPFLQQWEAAAAAGQPVRAFTNKLLSPLPLEQAVDGLLRLLEARQGGLYQLGGEGELSFYEFAQRWFAGRPDALRLIEATRDASAPPGPALHNSLTTFMPNTCHACHRPALQPLSTPAAFTSVTSDCRPWNYPLKLAVCGACGLIQKQIDPAYLEQTTAIYQSYAIYAQSGGAEQAVFTADGGGLARSEQIIAWLGQATRLPGAGRLLEIGCGNGAFLGKFSAAQPGWELTGTEFDDKNRAVIEAIPNARLHCGGLDTLEGQFDLVIAIHLLEHIVDPVSLLREAAAKLKPGGRIFLQVPNVKESPFDLLIADHVSHFSVESLVALLAPAGFDLLAISDTNVPKELSLLLQPRGAAPAADAAQLAALAGSHLQLFAGLKQAAEQAEGVVGIFGSSISATWLASEVPGKIQFFVDEDSQRIGKSHMGLPIIGVDQVPAGASLLLPMNPAIARRIAARLAGSGLRFILPNQEKSHV